MPRRPLPGLAAAVGYVAVALLVLAPSIRPGHTVVPADAITQYSPYREVAGFRADNPILSDAATQFFPWMRFLGEHVREDGHWPAWNPLILGGVPATANGYVDVWYPPTSLLRVLDPFDAYNALVLFHLVVAALGVYALSRALGARWWSSWIAGLLAMASGAWLHWSLHLVHITAMVWLPWAMAAGWRVVERPTLRRGGALALVLAIWWLGGNAQYVYYGVLALCGWLAGALAWRRLGDEQRVVRAVVVLALAAAVGGAIAAPTLVPTWSASHGILRQHEPLDVLTETHLPLRHAVRLLVPDAVGNPADGFLYATGEEFAMDSPFVGVVTVVLAGAALAWGVRRRDRRVILLGVGVGAVLALAFLGPPHVVLHALLPGYDRFRGSARWIAVLPAFALPLGALGLDALATADRRLHRDFAFVAGGIVAVIALWLARELLVDSAPHAYLARRAALAVVIVVAVALTVRRPRWLVPVVALCAAAEVAFAAPRWFPDVVESTAYPMRPAVAALAERGGRFVRVGGPRELPAYFPPDIAMAYDIAEVSGLTPLFPSDYDRYLRLVDDYGATARELNVAPPLLHADEAASPLLDALDVRTLIASRSRTAPRVSPGPAVVVAEAKPATEAAMWRAVAAPDWQPTATSSVVGLAHDVKGGGTASAVTLDPDHEEWDVAAPAGGFVRFAGRYDEGWQATVDGRPARVLRADGIFRGVVVPPGRHTVVLDYHEPHQRGALLAAAIGLALALLAVVITPRHPSSK